MLAGTIGGEKATVDLRTERREHQRIRLRLPVRGALGDDDQQVHHGVTVDLCPRGLLFETDAGAFHPGAEVRLDLTVPPGEGYSPYPGVIRGVGEVLRVEDRGATTAPTAHGPRHRFSVAARFREPVEFEF